MWFVIPISLGDLLQSCIPRKLGLQFTKPAFDMVAAMARESFEPGGCVREKGTGEFGSWCVVKDGLDSLLWLLGREDGWCNRVGDVDL